MPYGNPVVAGTVLVRTAIQSIDYVAGVSGWAITRAGSVEFNNGTFRGTLVAGGGNITLGATGLHVQGVGRQMDINASAAFLARNSPDDGTTVQITEDGAFFAPQNPSPGGNNLGFGFVTAGIDNPGAANEAPNIVLQSPAIATKSAAFLGLRGQAANDASPDNSSNIDIGADDVNILVGTTRPTYSRGEMGGFLLSFGPAPSVTINITYAKTYSASPFPYITIDTAAGPTALCVTRPFNRSTTGFSMLLFSTDGTNRTFANVLISWDTVIM